MSRESIHHNGKAEPVESLTRSRTEIAEILAAVASAESPVTAYLESGELLFVTRIRHVDADAGRIVVNYGISKPANAALFSTKAIMLHCEHGHLHVRFLALSPVEVEYQGEPAIQMEFPEYLLQYRRRMHHRVRIPPQLRMKCIVECPGVISFDMDVQDISRGGVGMVVHDSDIRLDPGTVLRGCLIKHPLHHPLRADLEIRHSSVVQLPDGKCLFAGTSGPGGAATTNCTVGRR